MVSVCVEIRESLVACGRKSK